METKACELPAPLRINQNHPEWSEKELNDSEPFNEGCMFFSVMNAYCGIRGLCYDEPYSLVDINKNLPIPDGYIKEETKGENLNNAFIDTKKNNRFPTRYGEIVKYIGKDKETEIQKYIHPADLNKGVRIEGTGNYFTNGNQYRLMDTYDKAIKERTWTWVDLGTRKLTNIDLFSSGTYVTTPQWYKGLGLDAKIGIVQTPAEFPKIIKALQDGSYVVLNVPNSYENKNGHAIVLYGVKSNGEVLYVDSSVPALDALEDYRATIGSMFLQNLIPEGLGLYQIISEGETKTLLNETVENGMDVIGKYLMEVIMKMDISLMKQEYINIPQTETVEELTFSDFDFEPKIVFFNTTSGRNVLYSGFPELTTGINAINGIIGNVWVNATISDDNLEFAMMACYQKDSTTTSHRDLKTTFTNDVNLSLISVEKNPSTKKWDVTIGGKSNSETALNRILGGEGITYNLFVAG
jgi:hypothetical protein